MVLVLGLHDDLRAGRTGAGAVGVDILDDDVGRLSLRPPACAGCRRSCRPSRRVPAEAAGRKEHDHGAGEGELGMGDAPALAGTRPHHGRPAFLHPFPPVRAPVGRVGVRGRMPDHRHGANDRPAAAAGPMFHMPRRERLTAETVLERHPGARACPSPSGCCRYSRSSSPRSWASPRRRRRSTSPPRRNAGSCATGRGRRPARSCLSPSRASLAGRHIVRSRRRPERQGAGQRPGSPR